MAFGTLSLLPVSDQLDQVSSPTREFLVTHHDFAQEVQVVIIDPSFSDTANFCNEYAIAPNQTVTCVILEAVRGDRSWYAVCLVLGNRRADINGVARRQLGARRVSFASRENAVHKTNMEYGAITAVGVPKDWSILIDSRIIETETVVLGSGVRGSKLVMPGRLFAQLPNAVVLEGLGREVV